MQCSSSVRQTSKDLEAAGLWSTQCVSVCVCVLFQVVLKQCWVMWWNTVGFYPYQVFSPFTHTQNSPTGERNILHWITQHNNLTCSTVSRFQGILYRVRFLIQCGCYVNLNWIILGCTTTANRHGVHDDKLELKYKVVIKLLNAQTHTCFENFPIIQFIIYIYVCVSTILHTYYIFKCVW